MGFDLSNVEGGGDDFDPMQLLREAVVEAAQTAIESYATMFDMCANEGQATALREVTGDPEIWIETAFNVAIGEGDPGDLYSIAEAFPSSLEAVSEIVDEGIAMLEPGEAAQAAMEFFL